MDEGRFIPFAVLLQRGDVPVPVSAAAPSVSGASVAAAAPVTPAAPGDGEKRLEGGARELVGDLAVMRAAAVEAFERASARLLRDLAEEVLARELALAPADTGALVRRFVAELADYEPLALAISPADAGQVRAALPVRIDPNLRAGDAILEVRDGAFESRLVLRVESIVAAALREAA